MPNNQKKITPSIERYDSVFEQEVRRFIRRLNTDLETLSNTVSNLSSSTGSSLSDGDKGDITVSGSGATWTIDNDVVTFAKQANVSTNTITGRITAGAGDQESLTPTQVTSMLDVFTNLLKGLVPASGGGTVNFLRADGTWTAPTTSVSITKVELDFGATPVDSIQFTVVDAAVSTSSKIIIVQSGEAATGRDADENEMDPIHVSAKPETGQFKVLAHSLKGRVTGKFKFNYQVA